MEVVTIAVDKSTILEIRKTIALLFQSSLTALVGAIIKAKGIYWKTEVCYGFRIFVLHIKRDVVF